MQFIITRQHKNPMTIQTHGPHATPPVGKFDRHKLCKTRESCRHVFIQGRSVTGMVLMQDLIRTNKQTSKHITFGRSAPYRRTSAYIKQHTRLYKVAYPSIKQFTESTLMHKSDSKLQNYTTKLHRIQLRHGTTKLSSKNNTDIFTLKFHTVQNNNKNDKNVLRVAMLKS